MSSRAPSTSPLRILQVAVAMNRGGLEAFIMNVYRAIDRNRFQFDFLVHREGRGAFDDEIEALGGKIHRIPYVTKVGHFGYMRALDRFFAANPQSKIVHSHINTVSGLVLGGAKRAGVPIRIAHSHNTRFAHSMIEGLYKRAVATRIRPNATHLIACSKEAGVALFGAQAGAETRIVPNGIDPQRFDRSDREITAGGAQLWRDLGIGQDALTILHVGRFTKQKNHAELLRIFAAVRARNSKALLLLAGDGPLRRDIEAQASQMGISDSIHFLGLRGDVPRLMCCADVFVMPSLHEGLPVAAIEAQAAGLRCLLADTISREADLGMGSVSFLPLGAPEKWAEAIVAPFELPSAEKIRERLVQTGYDIRTTAGLMEKFYLSLAQ